MTDAPPCEAWVRADELVALIARQALTQGLTPSAAWPGLVFSRYEQRGLPPGRRLALPRCAWLRRVANVSALARSIILLTPSMPWS